MISIKILEEIRREMSTKLYDQITSLREGEILSAKIEGTNYLVKVADKEELAMMNIERVFEDLIKSGKLDNDIDTLLRGLARNRRR